jgi:hypothetical protein
MVVGRAGISLAVNACSIWRSVKGTLSLDNFWVDDTIKLELGVKTIQNGGKTWEKNYSKEVRHSF